MNPTQLIYNYNLRYFFYKTIFIRYFRLDTVSNVSNNTWVLQFINFVTFWKYKTSTNNPGIARFLHYEQLNAKYVWAILNYNRTSKIRRFRSISMAKDSVWPNSLLTSFDMSGVIFYRRCPKGSIFWEDRVIWLIAHYSFKRAAPIIQYDTVALKINGVNASDSSA